VGRRKEKKRKEKKKKRKEREKNTFIKATKCHFLLFQKLQITSNHSKEQKPLIVLFPSPVPSKS
jgi:acetyl-CoA carboxylase beta subunit